MYLFLYIYVHICIYIYIHIHIHTYTHTYIYSHIHTYIYIYTSMYILVHFHIFSHMCTCICTYIHIYIYTYIPKAAQSYQKKHRLLSHFLNLPQPVLCGILHIQESLSSLFLPFSTDRMGNLGDVCTYEEFLEMYAHMFV